MKVVLAPNAFKGSLTARAAAKAMAQGVSAAQPDAETVEVPVADGGDGVVDILIGALRGEARTATVMGPRGDPVDATFCYVPSLDLAAIEMASASGLALLPEEQRDPMMTTTYGTGELITAALNLGVDRIVIGIGGSATNDGGIGMASALGVSFLDDADDPVEPVGEALQDIQRIDISGLDNRVRHVRIEAVCDVENPLLGTDGAARVYGPQKGATSEQVEELEAGLGNLAKVIARDLGIDVRTMPGAGAAGGLGAGLLAFVDAELRKGVDLILELVGLDDKLASADLVLTAEGHIDFQTAFGKAPAGVAMRAKARHIPCIAIAGSLGAGLDDLHAIGINAMFSLCPGPVSLDQAMAESANYLTAATEQAVRCFLAGSAPWPQNALSPQNKRRFGGGSDQP
jgi:glycerate kinase